VDGWTACVFYDSLDDDLDCCPTWGGADCGDPSKCGEDEDFDRVATEGLNRSPVWYTPSLARGPRNKLIVYFSTGHIETNAVATATNKNYLFAMIDDSPIGGTGCGYENYARPITPEIAGTDDVYWPIQFDIGEKLISQPLITEGMLIFKTYLPLSADACAMGTVRLWMIDYLTGGATWGAFAGGADPRYDEDPGYSTTDISIGPDGRIWQTQLEGFGGGGECPPGSSDCGGGMCVSMGESCPCEEGQTRCKNGNCVTAGTPCCPKGQIESKNGQCAPNKSVCPVLDPGAPAAKPMSWGEGVIVEDF
jgi:hypothetical protein